MFARTFFIIIAKKHPVVKFILTLLFLAGSLGVYSQDTLYVVFDDEPDTVVIPLDSVRSRILTEAKAYLGVPYRYGQSSATGFDCSGYVKFVYGNLGFELPRSSYEQYKKSQHLKKKDAQPGDLVFFKTRKRSIGHVGIYLGDDQFIHAPSKGKTVSIASLEGPYFKKRLVGFGGYL